MATCCLCDQEFPHDAILDHLRSYHPDRFVLDVRPLPRFSAVVEVTPEHATSE